MRPTYRLFPSLLFLATTVCVAMAQASGDPSSPSLGAPSSPTTSQPSPVTNPSPSQLPDLTTATVTAIVPATVFPDNQGEYNFLILGDNFSTDPAGDDVTTQGWASLIAPDHRTSRELDCKSLHPCVWVENSHVLHIYHLSANGQYGNLPIGLVVAGKHAGGDTKVSLVHFRRIHLLLMSLAATLLLFALVELVVWRGTSKNLIGTRKLNRFETFIFDPETNSYSLSKFQLMAFTLTFLFAYIYMLLLNCFVQFNFSLPEVPASIAALLGISSGAAVFAAGLTSARGPKGAGLQTPTGADLISTGGVVVPERFQFFVWTVVFCVGFLAVLLDQDLTAVSQFPRIPEGLLYLMGVSATGYLAGKAARKPGPVLEIVSAERLSGGSWLITAQGQNLGSDGRFFVEDDNANTELGVVPDEIKRGASLIGTTRQLGTTDPNFCTQLKVTVLNVDAAAAIARAYASLRFRIVNQDGQFAELAITPPAPATLPLPAPDTPVSSDSIGPGTQSQTAAMKQSARANPSAPTADPGKTDATHPIENIGELDTSGPVMGTAAATAAPAHGPVGDFPDVTSAGSAS